MAVAATGQLPASPAAIYTRGNPGASPNLADVVFASVAVANRSSSLTQTITLTYTRALDAAPTARNLPPQIVLGPNESAVFQGLPLQYNDAIGGTTTTAATVDYVVSITTQVQPFSAQVFDKSGNFKQTTVSAPSPAPQGAGSTLTLTSANRNQPILLNQAAGSVVTLPAATGTGNVYQFTTTTTVTSNNHKILAASTADFLQGNVVTEDGGTCTGWNATAAGTFCSLRMNGSTTGGFLGDSFTFTDVATNLWQVTGTTKSTGTAATPFNTADT